MSEELGFTVDYSKLTKEQLKQLCKQNGLKTSGNKADLLTRLNEKDDVPVERVQKKIRIDCPYCSKTLMFPLWHNEELRCPSCSNVFDPRVSTFVSKHGVQVKLQNTGERKTIAFSIFTLYCALFFLGFSGVGIYVEENCFMYLLFLFTFLPFIGLMVSGGEKEGSWKRLMVGIFSVLSAIHVLLFIGIIMVISSLSGLGN